VVAAGAWSGLLKGLVPEIPVLSCQGRGAASPGGTPPFRHTLHTPWVYLVPRLDGRVVVGATEKHGAGYDKTVGADAVGISCSTRAVRLRPCLRARISWTPGRDCARERSTAGPSSGPARCRAGLLHGALSQRGAAGAAHRAADDPVSCWRVAAGRVASLRAGSIRFVFHDFRFGHWVIAAHRHSYPS
jgi:hypothetical protein